MNLELKVVFFCVTNHNTWGKGETITEAKKNAQVNKKSQYYVQAAMLNDPTYGEYNIVRSCITANPIDGSPRYELDTPEEIDTVNKVHVGWCIVDKNI